jgi:hypothetical protein
MAYPLLGANAQSIYHRVAKFAEGLLLASLQCSARFLLHRSDLATKWFMSLRSPTENESADFVMPARIAGIQVCGMRPETSMSTWVPGTPWWNDEIVGGISEVPQRRIFEGGLKAAKAAIQNESIPLCISPSFAGERREGARDCSKKRSSNDEHRQKICASRFTLRPRRLRR